MSVDGSVASREFCLTLHDLEFATLDASLRFPSSMLACWRGLRCHPFRVLVPSCGLNLRTSIRLSVRVHTDVCDDVDVSRDACGPLHRPSFLPLSSLLPSKLPLFLCATPSFVSLHPILSPSLSSHLPPSPQRRSPPSPTRSTGRHIDRDGERGVVKRCELL